MKYFVSILIFIAFLTSAYSQQQFKAKDGISASTKAASDGGLNSPELVLIATTSEQMEGIPITISFDLSKGTATAWFYLYRSAIDKDSLKLIAVTKILNTYLPITLPLTGMGNLIIFRRDTNLYNAVWFDSDVMAQKIKENSVFQEYSTSNKDFKLTVAYVTISPLPEPEDLLNKAIWVVAFNSSGGRLSCLVNGETGEVFCQQIATDVASEEINSFKVLNNPASENLYLSIPLINQSDNSQFLIFNSNGSLIKKFNLINSGISELISLSISSFDNGVYFLKYINGQSIFTAPFIVIK
ncbi:MAG: T9SS type A sorting domain-containing protein [Candidatus Kapabacteria bacterium]|nr:T9SS type A sorting domain-containing protein [Candidatus Kapabacteria bacterium]